ncbi:hypothetical protein ACFVIM_30460 [Streptomyces sp. NPDC057638]|uniref:hypothetical protein n=1 Tax=Streptomyces sp. NPDC057638 TaxID=3346190 RepID=UPI0036867B5B
MGSSDDQDIPLLVRLPLAGEVEGAGAVMRCPGCEGWLAQGRPEWWVCGGCGYEIHHDALGLHAVLVGAYEDHPDGFFKWVALRRDVVRAEAPGWQRPR